MALIAKASGGSIAPQLEEGVYTGVCTRLIDLGEQFNEKFGKINHRVKIGWDIAGEKIQLTDGTEVNRTMYKEYTLSLHDRSGLRRDLQSWRGKSFTQEELDGFDLKQILGVPCQIQIIHNDKGYADISAIMAMPKGIPKPLGEYPQIYFDLDDSVTFSEYEGLPDWIKDSIKNAVKLSETQFGKYLSEKGEIVPYTDGYTDMDANEDDLPF